MNAALNDPPGLVRLVEDDADLLAAQMQGLRLAGFEVEPFARATDALTGLDAGYPGIVLTDVRMPQMDGLELAARLRAIDAELPVILITGHGDIDMAVRALKDGAYDFLTKPVGGDTLQATLRRALSSRRLVLENRMLRAAARAGEDDDGLVGTSAEIVHLREVMPRIAAARLDTLIVGETGTGKDHVARILHRKSGTRGRNFVHVSCATIVPERFDADFLGVVGGTGSHARTAGRLEKAHRGTLFLDEIDALSPEVQARILAVIEKKEFWPLGAEAPRPLDLWVITATRADIAERVRAGEFRADLFYRLSGVTLTLSPLRQRREDVPLLFRHFLLAAAARLGHPVPMLTPALKARLATYDWPGNARELEQFAERYLFGLDEAVADELGRLKDPPLSDLVALYEAELIREALRLCKGNATAAMERLRLPRKTFYDKVGRYGIRIKEFRG